METRDSPRLPSTIVHAPLSPPAPLGRTWTERVALAGPRFPATHDGALAWTERFIQADPAHVAILKDIESCGQEHGVNHFYAGRTDPWHAGEHANAVMLTMLRPIFNPRQAEIRPEYLPAIPLVRRLSPALGKYMRGDRNVFPLDDWFIASFVRPGFAAGMLEMCDTAERWATTGDRSIIDEVRTALGDSR